MTEPAAYDEKTTPAVSLAGKLWPIPELAPRQLRTARRLIIDLTDALAPVPKKDDEGKVLEDEPPLKSSRDQLISMSTADYGNMMEIVYLGVTRAHPSMKREEFDDMPITDAEMYLAFTVVRRQSGIYTAPPAIIAKPDAGEAPASQ